MGKDIKQKVSIIIPCRNEEKYIRECLESIVKQSYGIDNIEVLVMDGCSEDNTSNIVSEFTAEYRQIKLIRNERKTAPTAMNLGIENSTGNVIVLVGGHSYLDKNYIENCIIKLEQSGAACVGGKIINISNDSSSEAISCAMGSPFGVGNALFRYTNNEQYVDTVAFGAYRKEIFDKIGYFDEELVRNQDDELNFRLTKGGGKIFLSPSILSYYYTRSSFKRLWRQYYQYGFWKVRVIQKHKKPASIRHLIPILFVLSIIFGSLLSIYSKPIRFMFLAELISYFACALIFSVKAANKKVSYIPSIIFSFLILHISYGLGFLEGLFAFYLFKSNKYVENNTKSSR
jgi:glycosyltransferase involved in cell wall biosynthesis